MSAPGSGSRMPVFFVGHGNPMNAIEDNRWSRGFRELRARVPRPRAILSISAHWTVAGTQLTSNERPATIHDFGGFPHALYEVRYPAPGDVELARRAVELLGPERAELSGNWGLDHGTWSVLVHLVPEADIPVVQLSLDERLPPQEHLALGRALEGLRDEGVLVLGSGNIVHNLRHAFGNYRRGDATTPSWAEAFDADVARALEQRDSAFLAAALDGAAGQTAHPTPEHYLPLLYTLGAAGTRGSVEFPVTGFDMSSLSMRCALFT